MLVLVLSILVNTLKLVDNSNGSMSTARRCHRDRSIGNFCQLGWSLYESKYLSSLGTLTTGPEVGPWGLTEASPKWSSGNAWRRWGRKIDQPPLHTWDHVPPLHDAHDPRVRTSLGPAPPPLDILIAYQLFSRENGPIRDSNRGTPSSFMQTSVRTSWTPQWCGNGYTAIASHGHCRAVWLAMVAVVRLDNGRIPLRWRGRACLMAGVCPYRVLSGHTTIASHGHCVMGSMASYGGRCLVSTRVEGRYLPDGWHLPRPWKLFGPHGGAGESQGWLNSHEGEPWPGQVRGTRKGDAHLVRQSRWAKGTGCGRLHLHFQPSNVEMIPQVWLACGICWLAPLTR